MTEKVPRLGFFYQGMHEPLAVHGNNLNDAGNSPWMPRGLPAHAAGMVLTVLTAVAIVALVMPARAPYRSR